MGVDVTTETVIARPRHEVAAFAVDPDRLPLWYVNIRAIEWKTEPPLQIGTRLALAAQLLRRRLEYVYEVVEKGRSRWRPATGGATPARTARR
jgi:hypothetical protein